MLASLKGGLQMASATGIFLFHQELVESTSDLVEKIIILFSNFLFSCLSRSGLGRSSLHLTLLSEAVRNLLALSLPSVGALDG